MVLTNKRASQFIFLNLCLIIFYFLIYLSLKISANDIIMFSSPDSRDYLSIGNWIFEHIDTDQTLYNPILYPFILKLSLILFGVKGIWLLQFFFWIASINFLFYAIKQVTNKLIAFIGAGVLSVNLSYIALTIHALTDVMVTFTICAFIFYLSKRIKDFKKSRSFCIVLLFFSFLSIIKPVFFPVFLFLIFLVFPVFYFKDFSRNKNKFLLFIALMPIILQLSLMVFRHNTFNLSAKGDLTFKNFYFAQGFAEVNKISLDEAIEIVKSQSSKSMLFFILDNKTVFVTNFFYNIISENITGRPTFLDYPPGYRHVIFYIIMIIQNWFFLILHLLFLIPCLYLIFLLKKTKSSILGFYSFLLFLFYYLVLIMGIAFWQGDRYIIAFQPLWIILYSMVSFKLYPIIRPVVKNRFPVIG